MADDTFKLDKESEEKELVWLPVSLVKKLKRTQDKGEQETLILKYIDESERDIQYSIESLEDEVVRYKGAMLKARKAFEEAKNEQLGANYAMWEKFEEELPSLEKKIETVKDLVAPVANQIEDLEKTLEKLQTYRIEDLLKLIENINRELCYDSNTSKILKFLVKEYKPEANHK